jgi:hypothetical protein
MNGVEPTNGERRYIELTGIDGRNPMGYFAALGVLLAVSRVRSDLVPRLSWTATPIPRPVLHGELDIDELIDALELDRQRWQGAVALNFGDLDDVKLSATQQRDYLRACRIADDDGRSSLLASALVAEGAFAKTGDGKPTDLHFSAGQQRFLVIARGLQERVRPDDLREGVVGPWLYAKAFGTFGWDVSDDRVYALSVSNPSSDTKYTVPGADWLALVGLSAFPVVRDEGKATPPGASGSWKRGAFAWGLWSSPLDWASAAAFVSQGCADVTRASRVGLFRTMRSAIRRSDQGGYGSFSPSTVVWEA